MEKEIKHTLHYFGFFKYAPLKDEIYLFFKKKTTYSVFEDKLAQFVKEKKIKSLPNNPPRYTLGEYSISGKYMDKKTRISNRKIKMMGRYIYLLSLFPQIRLVGLSGSVAMRNAEKDADVDFFIITAKNRLWTARFMAIGLAKLLGIHRRYDEAHVGNKACLNLFFEERGLRVPKRKRSEYVAHEILQMKTQVVKDDAYLIYLDSNRWIFDIFPNAKKMPISKAPRKRVNNLQIPVLGQLMEGIFRQFQLLSISRRRTTEIITGTQLWFFPDDFENKISSYEISSRKIRK